MLRLNPTQIRLEKRDLDWHIPRFEERQASQAAVPPRDIGETTKRIPKKHQGDGAIRPVPHPPKPPLSSKTPGFYDGPDTEIYCDEPVPRGSRAFWDQRLAEVGIATVQTITAATARIVEPSDEFLDSTHSSRVSIEEVSVDGGGNSPDGESTSSSDAEITPDTDDPPTSGLAIGSQETRSIAEQTEQQGRSARSIFSVLPGWRRRSHRVEGSNSNSLDLTHVNHRLSSSMAVDGPSDRSDNPSSYHRNASGSSSVDSPPRLNDNLYGNIHDRRTLSASESSTSDLGYDPNLRLNGRSRNPSANLPRSPLHISEAAASSSPERPLRTPQDNSPEYLRSQGLLSLPPRRRRTYRPRSQTYSWEQSEGSSSNAVPQVDGTSALRSLTTRLPSLTISHASEIRESGRRGPTNYQPPMASPPASVNRSLPSSPPDTRQYYARRVRLPSTQPQSTPSTLSPQQPVEIRNYRSTPSIRSNYSNNTLESSPNSFLSPRDDTTGPPSVLPPPPRRRLSPFAAPFLPGNAFRTSPAQFPLPASFSSTRRNVSLPYTYHYTSPGSPQTPPHQRQPSVPISPLPHNTPHSQHTSQRTNSPTFLQTPNPPYHSSTNLTPPNRQVTTPRIAVYNDSLPPHTQPQTPVGLPRHGIPPMATTNPFPNRNAVYTERPSWRARGVEDWQAFATPTRAGSGRGRGRARLGLGEEQENGFGTGRR